MNLVATSLFHGDSNLTFMSDKQMIHNRLFSLSFIDVSLMGFYSYKLSSLS